MRDVFSSLMFDVVSGLIGTAVVSLMILAWRRIDPEAARQYVGRFGWPAASAAFFLVASSVAVVRGASGFSALALVVALGLAAGLMLFVRLGPEHVREVGHRIGDVAWPALACVMFLLCLQLVLRSREPVDRVVLAVDLADDELIAFSDVMRELEPRLGARIVLRPTESGQQFERLSRMVQRGRVEWDLLAFDNDLAGAMDDAGLVRGLGAGWSPPPELIPQLGGLISPRGGPPRFVPLRAGLRLGYFDDRRLRDDLGLDPPNDLAELVEFAGQLQREYRGDPRVVLQARPGKPAATTMCELIGTDPDSWTEDSLSDEFHALRGLGLRLHERSAKADFDLVRDLIDLGEVDLACNWTSGGRPWIGEEQSRRPIAVYRGWQRWHVLGGDVLAIPQEAPNPELAHRLVGLLIEARTQRRLAEELHWIPARLDAFDGLPDDLRRAAVPAIPRGVLRPGGPSWPETERALSDALLELIIGREDVDLVLCRFLSRVKFGGAVADPKAGGPDPAGMSASLRIEPSGARRRKDR